MALTRANVERILIRRCGTALEKAGLDYLTDNGKNPDLNDPVGYGVRMLGGTVADVTEVADSDVSGVATDDYDALFDLAECRLTETLYNTVLDLVDTQVGPQRQSLSQWAEALGRKAARMTARIVQVHGVGGGTLSAGVIDMDFMEKSGDA
jgi:hypothetical protein